MTPFKATGVEFYKWLQEKWDKPKAFPKLTKEEERAMNKMMIKIIIEVEDGAKLELMVR